MRSRADIIRRAIMISMGMTGERFRTVAGDELYSHDDYDAAHAALGSLVAENQRLRDALERIVWTDKQGPEDHELAEIARAALACMPSEDT